MKAGVTDRIYSPQGTGIKGLLQLMLRDAVAEIRQSAARLSLNRSGDFTLPQLVFDEMARPGTPLQPFETYSYSFDSICGEARLQQKVITWVQQQLSDKDSPHTHIPALIAARSASNPAIAELIFTYTSSPLPLVRRAAWNALSFAQPTLFAENAATIAADPDARVRGALTNYYLINTNNWKHHFTDATIVDDNRSSYNDKATQPTEPILALLTAVSTGDPAASLRFEASLALLTYGKPVDIDLCLSAFTQHPSPDSAKYTLTRWLDNNAQRLTPAMGPLLRSIDTSRLSESTQQTIRKKISPSSEKGGLTSFESLIAREKSEAASGPATLAAAPEKPTEPVVRNYLDAIYFYKAGCKECEQARQYLDSLKKDFPLLRVEEYDILNPQGTVLNQALCARFGVPSLQQNLSPAVFTQSGFLVKEQINPSALGALFKETMNTSENDEWKTITTEQAAVASQQVEARYESLSLPVVLIAGLLDGVNPCAFATIIFFLSYLQIARRSPREVLMVGIAFISAVFIAYFLAGLALYEFISYFMGRFPWLQGSLNIVFATLALLAAWLSFRDALRARAGRMDEMSLQLPSAFKDRIRTIIRTGAKARYFVLAAFVSGILISFLELACTGQVYAPIIYQIKSGNLNAVRWLALYNLAFVTPLIIIFLLAWSGMRSDALIAFQKKHTATVKFALALLFVALALFILFGHLWLKP
jgi:cytochrome c biogenesis protein CcdA